MIDGQWKEDPRFVWNRNLGFEQADDHPVVNVTWNDVTAFCAWLSEKEGVGQKSPNAWGLYDMHGNVWEWCQDWFGGRYYATSPVDDPPGASGGSFRVCRGGGWSYVAAYGRASFRYGYDPGYRGGHLGFRLVRIVSLPVSGAASPQKSGDKAPQSKDRATPKPTAAATPPPTAKPVPPWTLPAGSPPPAIAPFDAAKAKEHQAAWAKHLGLQVEVTNSIGMKFVLIPPGEFDMGSTDEEVAKLLEEAKATKQTSWYIDSLPSEAPKHRVRITKPFYLGRCEVTQTEYERVVGSNPSQLKGNPTHPVEMVSWDDASAFCRKLGALPQEQAARAEYRLPTEGEWEHACRAGTTMPWYSGDDVEALEEHAWLKNNAGGKTHPVGQKSPNAWGLYDMHGNVWEWCQDWFGDRYYATSPLDDPPGVSGGSIRVHRGGGWHAVASGGRASCRGRDAPGNRGGSLGFRLARTVSSPP